MKKVACFILYIICLITGSACSDNDTQMTPELEVGSETVLFPKTETTSVVDVNTNVENWSATVDEAGRSWCTVKLQTGQANKLNISVTSNSGMTERSATITVTAMELQRQIIVQQIGSTPVIKTGKDAYEVTDKSNTLEIQVISNIEFDTIISVSWIKKAPTLRSDGEKEYKFPLQIERNLNPDSRKGTVTFKQKGGELTKVVEIIQKKKNSEYEPDENSGFEGDTQIPVISGLASEAQSGAGIEKSFDNDLATIYHSRWGTNTVFPVTLTYNFAGSDTIDYLIYYPRTDGGSNGRFGKLEVFVSSASATELKSIGTFDFAGSSSPTTITLDQKLINPKAVQFKVASGTGDNVSQYVSCAEMKFFKKNQANYDATIFTDELCSELKPEVTEEMIRKMNNTFLQNIALSLFRNEYPKEFRIQSYKPYPRPETAASSNKTSTYNLLDNPTGIYIPAAGEVIVFVGDTKGTSLSLKVMDFDQGYSGADYPLSSGINKLNVSGKGLAYIMYHTSNSVAQPIKIHIASGKVNGYFDSKKHAESDWSRLLNQATDKYFDVLGEYAHITFPVSSFKSYTPKVLELIKVYDDISRLEQQHLGLFKYNRVNKNRMYFHVIPDSYMYATSYRTAYNIGTMPELCDAQRLKTSSIWGPAHEVGHVNQTRPGFRWIGMTEVSNNVSSLYVQTSLGNTSRLIEDKRYEKGYESIISTHTVHGVADDVFCKLIPFWQIELYYAKVKNNTDIYADIYQALRIGNDPETNGELQLNFIKICCDQVKENLTDFFSAWGLLSAVDATLDDYGNGRLYITSEQVNTLKEYLKKYPDPKHKVQYIRDDNVNLYTSNAGVVKGSVSVSGSSLTLSGWQNVVVYEAYDNNGQLLLATYKNTFTVPQTATNVYAISASGDRTKIDY